MTKEVVVNPLKEALKQAKDALKILRKVACSTG